MALHDFPETMIFHRNLSKNFAQNYFRRSIFFPNAQQRGKCQNPAIVRVSMSHICVKMHHDSWPSVSFCYTISLEHVLKEESVSIDDLCRFDECKVFCRTAGYWTHVQSAYKRMCDPHGHKAAPFQTFNTRTFVRQRYILRPYDLRPTMLQLIWLLHLLKFLIVIYSDFCPLSVRPIIIQRSVFQSFVSKVSTQVQATHRAQLIRAMNRNRDALSKMTVATEQLDMIVDLPESKNIISKEMKSRSSRSSGRRC